MRNYIDYVCPRSSVFLVVSYGGNPGITQKGASVASDAGSFDRSLGPSITNTEPQHQIGNF